MKEEYKGIEVNNDIKTLYFNLYKTLSGLYIEKNIADYFDVGKFNDTKTIRGVECVNISEDELNTIERISKNQNYQLIPNNISIFDLQIVINYIVYVDKNHDDILYISNSLSDKYDINPISKRMINKLSYSQITNSDLDKIELKSRAENPTLKRKYVEICLEDKIKPAEKLFIYFHNIDDDKLYIGRGTLEDIRKNEIQIETQPIIIEDKNCYSITEEKLKEYEEKSHSHGVEKIVTTNISRKEEENEVKCETIMVYRDCSTDKLYIEKDKIERYNKENEKVILNKLCCETSIIELENTHNKRFIIVDVYTKSNIKNYNILICNCNNDYYISENDLRIFNIELPNSKKIMINKEIYVNIDNNIITYINNLNNDNTNISIKYRQIVPVNKS